MVEVTEIIDQVADEAKGILQVAKEFFFGDPTSAFLTGTAFGFGLAYGLLKCSFHLN